MKLCILLTLLVLSSASYPADDDDDDVVNNNDFQQTKRPNRFCVPYYQCRNGNLITDGSGLLDPRKKNPTTEMTLDAKLDSSYCVSPYVLCKFSNGSLNEQPYNHHCGVRRPNGVDSRILAARQNGETEFGEFPWQGAILQEVNDQMIFKCACVLIDKRWALTAAHCVVPLRNSRRRLFAVFGVRDIKTETEPLPHQRVHIANFTVHPEYDSEALRNDIALVTFRHPVNYTPSVDTICLPTHTEKHVGQNCIVTGWGKNAWDDGKYSPVLRKVIVPVLNGSQCQDKLRKTRLGEFFNLHNSFICAGANEGQDACKGDGGGPLVCYRPGGTYALVGIVSWGIDCGQRNVPGVYVNVVKFLRWIYHVTKFDTDYFSPENRGQLF